MRQEQIKALTKDQLRTFLDATAKVSRAYGPFFLTLARTGMRLGEALGLQWEDLHLDEYTIRVERAISNGRVETPKSGHGRTVDVSPQLAKALLSVRMGRADQMKRHQWSTLPPWVFCTRSGTLLEPHNVRKIFRRCAPATFGRAPSHHSRRWDS